ncbi:hypothetical protein B0H19DRAFT_514964 [Mycena capillaripes]|nr:hypothetical protein B0H19DRAFT_514964 [Mycena capillaripes]
MWHAHDIQKSLNTARHRVLKYPNHDGLANNWTVAVDGIFSQAYTSAWEVVEEGDNDFFLVPVQIGNPGLYWMGYALPGLLVLSQCYSTNPEQAQNILRELGREGPPLVIHQAHLLRQKMALTVLDDNNRQYFETRTEHRSRPSVLARVEGSVARWMRQMHDTFTRLGEIVLRRPTANWDLSGVAVHVRSIRHTPKFISDFGEKLSFQSLQRGSVWGNGEWIVKIPASTEETLATRELSVVAGSVEFGAELVVTTGPHKGTLLLATRAAGERAGHLQAPVGDLEVHSVVGTLQRVHELGWHHHDIHPANIVVNQDNVTVIDYGRATRATQCQAPCPDNEALSWVESGFI